MSSELQAIKDEILRRFQRPRTADDVPGFAGGNLGEQIDREGQSPDRMSGVRSGSVFAPPQPQPQPVSTDAQINRHEPPMRPTQPLVDTSTVAPVANSQQRSVFAPPQQSADNAQPRDYVSEDAQRIRDLEAKSGGWKERAVGALRGVNQALGSNPNVFTPTRRERDEMKARGMLGQDLEIQRAQTAQQMAQMVPIYDTAGNIIGTAPRRTAAGTQIRATDTGTRANERADTNAERKRVNDARIKNYDSMDERRAHTEMSSDWKNGMYDNDPEMLEYVGKKMGMSGPAPQSNQGQVVTDKDGNFSIVRKSGGTSQTVTDKDTGKPVQSWVITKEQRQDDRARRAQSAAMDRTLVMAQATGARLGNPEDLDSIANEAQANADAATAKAQSLSASKIPSDKKLAGEYLSEAGRHQAQAAKAREAATKARSGQNFTAPGKIGANEDPQIRDYANKHFGGDYQKALANARKTGYNK